MGKGKETDIRVVDVVVEFEPVEFRAPLKFGGRVIDRTDLINVDVTVENRRKKRASGSGSMPVGNIWAWPSDVVSAEQSEATMKRFAERLAELVGAYSEFNHPLDIVYQISGEYEHLGRVVAEECGAPEPMPTLAQLVAASPFDAALHDGFGRANDINSYNGLSEEFCHHDLAEYLDDQFAGEYLDRYTLREPKPRMPLYHLVGALDPLTEADIERRIEDGLPETLGEWIAADGLTHLKIKLAGDDLAWDLDRVIAVEDVAAEAQAARGCREWFYSLDFNEKCKDVEYLLEFLAKLKERRPQAYERIQYIEQPTSRDLRAYPFDMRPAAAQKPVVIDEALTDYDALLLAREQGYTGVALKACKGHTEALLAAAAAQKYGMFLCVQDLSCPGYSFLHSASLAARIPTVAAIEGNARQYCPGPNARWAKLYPGMFEITDGTVQTGLLNDVGLGF
ncbi:MAG: hypothetical protein D6725_15445 [Planctomycetota bacterium]|nr:MAG: hypothetical protein D6725_15445 [Planctomycetota bacterium]